MYKSFFKRLIDIVCSGTALLVLSPVLLITAFLVRVKLGSPVFFTQQRPGLNEKIFKIYKFRTMTDARDAEGNLLPDEVRLTSFGKLLRSTSLDELPELWNIFNGDMSVVGPRPQLVRDLVFMTAEQRKRHTVRPGLTGLAQISGRNGICWDEKLDFDLQYLQDISFVGDVKIILRTAIKVIQREGISAEGMDTALDLGDWLLSIKRISRDEYDGLQTMAKQLLERQV